MMSVEQVTHDAMMTATPLDDPAHVVLYFDVNKTVIMHDPVQDKGLDHILNDLITERALGRVVDDANGEAQWIWNGQPALRTRDINAANDVSGSDSSEVSYGAFLRAKYPMSADRAVAQRNKKQRKLLRQDFTSAGSAGEGLASEHRALLEQLRLPAVDATSQQQSPYSPETLADVGLSDGQHFFLLPSFLRFVQFLHARGTRFNLVFRTFGDDLARIALEFNCFCEGRHPFFPLANSERMDGSTGGSSIDRRIHLAPLPVESPRFGTFFRSDTVTALVMGTFAQPREGDAVQDLAFYSTLSVPGMPPLEVHTGLAAIYDVLMVRWRSQQATLAVRDFYPFWFHHREDARAGKLLPLDPRDHTVHALFFDDNILAHDAHIIDMRDVRDGAPIAFAGATQDTHLVRVESLEAIEHREFFIDKFLAVLARRRQQQQQVCE